MQAGEVVRMGPCGGGGGNARKDRHGGRGDTHCPGRRPPLPRRSRHSRNVHAERPGGDRALGTIYPGDGSLRGWKGGMTTVPITLTNNG